MCWVNQIEACQLSVAEAFLAPAVFLSDALTLLSNTTYYNTN